jgi:heme O synthase-like polyprenyltransferase
MTRAEHLQWSKDRALAYCEKGDYKNAMSSMMSDLEKHPETQNHAGNQIGLMMMLGGMLNSRHECERFINGYN